MTVAAPVSVSGEQTLVITNDYPPRPGGIQTFVFEMVRRFAADSVTVLTSSFEGAEDFDSQNAWEVVRMDSEILLPKKATLLEAIKIIEEKKITRVVFGAAAPLGLLAKELRELGVEIIIGITHGHEAGWASTPGTRQALGRIGEYADRLTYLGSYTQTKISPALEPQDASKLRQLTPGVDTDEFHPGRKELAQAFRDQLGLKDRPVVVCVSRIMARKGQDTLIEAMLLIKQEVPDVALLIVGDGPYRPQLEKRIKALGLEEDVFLTGKVAKEDLPTWYAVGDIFAMPCRTRAAGWDVEGLGIVYLEASATGLPVVAGDSGGAPDAVIEGVTGFIVDARNEKPVAGALIHLLNDPKLAKEMGIAGRAWVEQSWTWDHSFNRLKQMLSGHDPDQVV